MQISEVLKLEKPSLQKSERAELIKELYGIYTSITQKKLRRIENWKRYVQWLKKNRIKHTPDKVTEFMKTSRKKILGKFIDEMSVTTFSILTSHIKTHELYYVISVSKDKDRRGENVGGWLFAKPTK